MLIFMHASYLYFFIYLLLLLLHSENLLLLLSHKIRTSHKINNPPTKNHHTLMASSLFYAYNLSEIPLIFCFQNTGFNLHIKFVDETK